MSGPRTHLSALRTSVLVAGAALAAGCDGETGTITLRLATAPGSTLLADVTAARITLGVPRREALATRGTDGKFHLDLEVPADGPTTRVTFEGLDASDELVAYGCTGPLPIAAIDAEVTIYVARPGTVAAAPVALARPRAEAGTADFSFGVLIAGGRDPAGAASAAVDVYSVYSHALQPGLDLPAPRRAPTVAAGVNGFAYVFGGADAAGADTGLLWRFDTTVAPAGAYQQLADMPAHARHGAAATALRPEVFVVTGAPPQAPLVIDGVTSALSALPPTPALTGTASTIVTDQTQGSVPIAIVAGAGTGTAGIGRITASGIDDEPAPPGAARTGHGAAVGGDRVITLVGGAIGAELATTAVRIDPVARRYTDVPAGLDTPRRDAAVAQTGRHILVAGGTDAAGTVLADAEVLDATTLDRVATIPLASPRTGASAHLLSSGQILLVGGTDAAGAPVATLEIFTPDPATAFSLGPVDCGY